MTYDIDELRSHFPALAKGVAHFDGPGGSQVPDVVADVIRDTLTSGVSNRGIVTSAERFADEVVISARLAMADLLGGQVHFLFDSVGTSHQYIKTGKVRALAVTSTTRNASLPDVPTMAEAGVPGYSSMPWYEISAPKGVPPAVIARLNTEINAVLKMQDVAKRLDNLGVLPIGGTPADAQKRNETETKKWSAVIDAAKMQAE